MSPVGILLAAGRGRRFDPAGLRNKLLQPLAGEPVVVASARKLLAAVPHVVAVVPPADGGVGERLAALGFPPDKLAGVAHAIEAHSFSAAVPATTLEARIVQDADRLDGLGAVGLARMFYIAGRMGSALAHGTDPLARERPLDDKAYALDHIDAKLARLPGMMQTDAGRALAAQRLATLTDFRAAFAAEWTGAD